MGNDANPNVEGEKLLLQIAVDEMRCILGHRVVKTQGTPHFYFDEDWNPY
jgi:hypothetical protein